MKRGEEKKNMKKDKRISGMDLYGLLWICMYSYGLVWIFLLLYEY